MGLELRSHTPSIPQRLPKHLQHRIVAPSKVQVPDVPAGDDERRPEFIMGTQHIANLGHSNLLCVERAFNLSVDRDLAREPRW